MNQQVKNLVDAVKNYAVRNYVYGHWDQVVCAYTDEQIAQIIRDANSVESAIERMARKLNAN